jgi:hypothetical protein
MPNMSSRALESNKQRIVERSGQWFIFSKIFIFNLFFLSKKSRKHLKNLNKPIYILKQSKN